MEGTIRSRQKNHVGWRAFVTVLATIITLVMLVVTVSDLLGYLMEPRDYPVGSEAAGIRYASPAHFLGATIGATVLYLLGLVSPLLIKDSTRRTAIRVAVAAWAVISTAVFVLTGE